MITGEETVHEPHDWADVEAHALVEADLALIEHVDGELARAEREREGEPRASPTS